MRTPSPECSPAPRAIRAATDRQRLSRRDGKGVTMILAVHPFGNANVRAVLDALDRNARLAKFVTTLGWSTSSPVLQALPESLRAEMMRRGYDVPHYKIKTHPVREVVRLLAQKFGI